MYSHFQLAKKYLHYYFTAANGKGHGVHSPFVFDFIQHILNDKKQYDCYSKIEGHREKLKSTNELIEVEDFGAGSTVIKTNKRAVKDIARSSLKPRKYAQLLFRIVRYYQPATIVEIGTSFGVTTAYLSNGNKNATVYTCEGATSIADIAGETFDAMRIKNIEIVRGDFNVSLPSLLSTIPPVNFAFIDGNHRKEPTLQYFQQLLNHSTASTIFVFDDLHWSSEMEEAWFAIQQDPAVTLTIDLFFIGIVFINPDFKVKQHFTIRF